MRPLRRGRHVIAAMEETNGNVTRPHVQHLHKRNEARPRRGR